MKLLIKKVEPAPVGYIPFGYNFSKNQTPICSTIKSCITVQDLGTAREFTITVENREKHLKKVLERTVKKNYELEKGARERKQKQDKEEEENRVGFFRLKKLEGQII